MTNTIKKEERDRIYARAAALYKEHGNRQAPAVVALMAEETISIDRARGAVAHAMLKTPPKDRRC